MKYRMIILAIVVTIVFSACGGGGGSGDACDFTVSLFTNGANAGVSTSYWSCQSAENTYGMAFYDDDTGYSTGIGAFTWSETGCASFSVASAYGNYSIANVVGSISSGIATFDQTNESTGTTIHNSCTLVEGVAADLMGEYDFEAELKQLKEL